jgi:hypothetical protein
MQSGFIRFRFTCAFLLLASFLVALPLAARQQRNPQQRSQGATPPQSTAPRRAPAPQQQQTPAPPTQEDDTAPQDDDEIITVESDLTNILFTALDKQKRFVSTLATG